MAYPQYDLAGLAEFTGRPQNSFTAYSTQAIKQATLLFKAATCLADLPDDPDKRDIAAMAIYAMADALYLAQPYQTLLASPFSSESIGSYSYSKMVTAVTNRMDTKIMWFDTAVQMMGVCGTSADQSGAFASGGIAAFEYDEVRVRQADGYDRLISPMSGDVEGQYVGGINPEIVELPLPDTWDGGEA